MRKNIPHGSNRIVWLAAAFVLLSAAVALESAETLNHSKQLQNLVDRGVAETVAKFAGNKLTTDELAVTLIDLTKPNAPASGSHRGSERIYPASVIKLFYLEAAHRWTEDGKIPDTPELRRAMRDMIVDSYNEATHYIIDLLTETTSGPELRPAEMKEWEHKRNAINRYFQGRGFTNINANQKPWGEGPYGRERVFVGEKFTNRNMLTTDATARLLTGIVLGQAVSRERSAEMLELMKRDPFSQTENPDDQAHGFIGPAVPGGANLWSKAGWTSQTRHDAAYIELPNGAKFVLVIFTVNHANERAIISTLAREIISGMEKDP